MTENNGSHEKMTPERFGEAALKFATETAYAAAGIANVVAEKARELIEQQRQTLADKTPEGVDPNFKKFVDTMPDQFKSILDEATKQFHDLAERGRATVADIQAQAKQKAEAFDLKEGAEAAEDVVAETAEDVKAEADMVDEGGAVSDEQPKDGTI